MVTITVHSSFIYSQESILAAGLSEFAAAHAPYHSAIFAMLSVSTICATLQANPVILVYETT